MKLRTLNLALISAGLLSACGGGSDGGVSPPTSGTPGTVTLTGVAARGAALAGASITARCAIGTGTATAGADGAYTLTLNDAALPCVLSASGDGLVLHSVATGSGAGAATAHITPLTELLVAQLSGAAPASFAANVGTAELAAIDSGDVAAAQAAVMATLDRAGLDTSALGNLVTGSLVAATAGGAGNGYDQVLDALSSALARSGSTLTELTTTVARGTPSLPAGLLQAASAANCDALRSSTYHYMILTPATSGGDVIGSFTLNAATLVATHPDGAVETWNAAGDCAYTFSGSVGTQDEMKVTPAGIIVARVYNQATGRYNLALAVPAQTHALADIAGEWNAMGWGGSTNSRVVAFTATVAANGAVTAASCFDDPISTTACAPDTTPLPVFSVNPEGGFTLNSTNPSDPGTDRLFAYRSGSGDLMMLQLVPSGRFILWTRKRTLALPAVGAVSSLWNFNLDTAATLPGGVGFTLNTVTALDAASGSYTRDSSSDGGSVSVPQTLRINNGRSGYFYRVPGSVTASDGSAATVREFYAMGLRGMGLTPVYLPATATSAALFVLSANRP